MKKLMIIGITILTIFSFVSIGNKKVNAATNGISDYLEFNLIKNERDALMYPMITLEIINKSDKRFEYEQIIVYYGSVGEVHKINELHNRIMPKTRVELPQIIVHKKKITKIVLKNVKELNKTGSSDLEADLTKVKTNLPDSEKSLNFKLKMLIIEENSKTFSRIVIGVTKNSVANFILTEKNSSEIYIKSGNKYNPPIKFGRNNNSDLVIDYDKGEIIITKEIEGTIDKISITNVEIVNDVFKDSFTKNDFEVDIFNYGILTAEEFDAQRQDEDLSIDVDYINKTGAINTEISLSFVNQGRFDYLIGTQYEEGKIQIENSLGRIYEYELRNNNFDSLFRVGKGTSYKTMKIEVPGKITKVRALNIVKVDQNENYLEGNHFTQVASLRNVEINESNQKSMQKNGLSISATDLIENGPGKYFLGLTVNNRSLNDTTFGFDPSVGATISVLTSSSTGYLTTGDIFREAFEPGRSKVYVEIYFLGDIESIVIEGIREIDYKGEVRGGLNFSLEVDVNRITRSKYNQNEISKYIIFAALLTIQVIVIYKKK